MSHVRELNMQTHHFRAPVPVERDYENMGVYRRATALWNDFVILGSKIDSSQNRLDYFAAGKALEDVIPSLTTISHPEVIGCFGAGYAISHPDLSVNNIFVDEDYNITCIIDWALSSTVPIPQLLATPGMPHPRDEPSPSATASFRTGFRNHIGTADGANSTLWSLRREDMAFHARVKMDSLDDFRHFSALYDLISNASVDSPLKYVRGLQQKLDMLDVKLALSSDDLSPEEIEAGRP
ncbi:hypothetical protein EDB80DRAFT_822257 [Ilyonectria destructans]|nr:hypothetical protein EDB80DRAFT_822257 [Ilyonectria destructans]